MSAQPVAGVLDVEPALAAALDQVADDRNDRQGERDRHDGPERAIERGLRDRVADPEHGHAHDNATDIPSGKAGVRLVWRRQAHQRDPRLRRVLVGTTDEIGGRVGSQHSRGHDQRARQTMLPFTELDQTVHPVADATSHQGEPEDRYDRCRPVLSVWGRSWRARPFDGDEEKFDHDQGDRDTNVPSPRPFPGQREDRQPVDQEDVSQSVFEV